MADKLEGRRKRMTAAEQKQKTAQRTAKLGSGERFAALKESIAEKGNVRNPGAVAAMIGRRKFGKERFQKLAAAGRKRGR